MKITQFILLTIAVIAISQSCERCKSKKIIDEGIIEYSISYDDSLKPNFNPKFLPDKFTVKFKGENALNMIEGLSGAVTVTFIKNLETKTRIVLIKLLSKKLYYQDSISNNTLNAFAGIPEMVINPIPESILFKGYNCFKVSAYYKDSLQQPFDIIYTNEIKVDKPNENTPFAGISGVMLKFKVDLYNHKMTFKATKITSTKISSEEFIIPAGYEQVNRKTIEEVIALIQ